jgi:hypothetical protein
MWSELPPARSIVRCCCVPGKGPFADHVIQENGLTIAEDFSTAVGADGLPIDRAHPFHARDRAASDAKPEATSEAAPQRKKWTYC